MAANVCSTNPVATVVAIQGEAYARNAIGQMRKLFVGDILLEGEIIVTMPGGHVELGFTDGKKLAVLPSEGFNMTAESLGVAKIGEATDADKELAAQNAKAAAKKAAGDAALQSGEIEQLVKAIEQGGAIDEQLEATAAGLGGGGEGEGHGFVRLPRIFEDVTPINFGWTPIGGGVLPPNPAADINLPPEADPDAQTLGEDTPSVSGNVISGLNSILVGSDDTDPDFDPLTVTAVSFGATNGTLGTAIAGVWGNLVLRPDGSYTYTPNAHAQTLGVGKTGVDVFNYTVQDPAGATDSTTLTLTVVGSNDAPIPYTIPGDPDKPPERDPNTDPTTGHYLHIIPEDTSVSGVVKATDVDGDPLTFTQNTPPSHGTAVVNPDGSYTYTPFQDYNGNDSFTVLVNDGNGGTAIAVVDIIITPVQDPSIITPGFGTVVEDTVLSTSGQLSITDVDGPQDQAFTPQSNVLGAHGSFSIDNNGNWVYNLNNADPAVQALNPGDTLTETFTVNGVDGTPSTVTVTIQGVPENIAPNANDDSVSTTVNTPVPIPVLGNDDDPDGDPLTIESFQPTTPHGTINQVGNQLVYTPNPGYTGTDTFTYTISDGRGGTDTATVTVQIGTGPVIPTISVNNSTVVEGVDAFAEFTVSLSNASASDISVSLVLNDNTATGGGVDYGAAGPSNIQVFTGGTWQNRTTATFATGETSILVRTPIINDSTDEVNETYTLTANVLSGTTTNPSATGTGTIIDDDGAPSLSITGPGTVNEAIGVVVYTVTLTGSSATPVTVSYGTADGTALDGVGDPAGTVADYTPTSGMLTFNPGQTTQTITVPILNDTPRVYEGAETYTVNLSGPSGATIATPTATTTIMDDGTGTPPTSSTPDDDRPVLSVNDVTVTEGVGSGYAQFTVSLSNASTQATTVSLTTTDGTALDGVGDPATPGVPDYSPTLAYSTNGGTTWVTGSTATIAAGATSILVRSAITDDATDESTEAFTLTATRTAGVTTNASDVGTGTILDNDGAPSLSITGPGTVNEAIGVVVYTVTLTGSSATPVTVSYGTADGTALDGVGDPAGTVADYTPTSGMLTFNPGQTTQTITVPILNDTPRVYEGAETYTVNLSGPSGATISTPTATTTIMDDGTGTPPTSSTPDDDRPVLSVNDVTVTEGVGSGYAQFTVSLSNASTQATTVSLTTTDGTARDGVGESGAGIPDYSPTLAYSTNGGTTWVTGSTATIAAGATSILVRSAITDDAVNESTEAFTLTATRTAGVTTNASDVGTGTILDNDGAPSLSITGPGTVNEAIGVVVYTVTLTGSSATPVTVSYGTADGTALDGVGDPAGTVADYTPTSGMLTFNPGQTTQTITVPILNDTPRVYEGAETYTVNLSGPSGATIATPTATTTIMDDGTGTPPTSSTPDDDRPVLSVNDVTVTEGVGSGYAQFTVSLSNASTQATTVSLTTTDGTARDGVGESGAGIPDYSPTLAYSTNGGTTWVTGSTATIAAGATSILVRSAITDDAVNESTEAFTLTATRTAGVTTNASDVGTGTILDNDGAPSLSITGPGTVNEAIGVVVYTVTLTGSSATPVTVSYGTADGTALDGVGDPAGTVADYTPTSGMLTFNPGQTTQTITVPILNDTPRVYEGAETYTVNLSGPSGATIATPTATTTIMDDGTGTPPTSSTPDDDRPVLSVNDVTVTEGVGSGYAQFTVSLSNASTQATTVSLTTTDGTARDGVGESGAGIPDYSPTLAYSTNGGTTWVTGSTATIAAGATSILVRSAITDDAVNESTEAFTLTATRTAGVTTNASDVGTGTILDNDAAPTLAITGPATVNEAIGTVVYTVTLTGSSATPVTVSYGTADGTALDGVGDPAGTVADYTPTSGMLTFNPGQTTQTITVPILNDTPRVYEGAETYTVNLSGPSGATIATPTATTTIMDDGTGTPPTSSTPDDDRPVLSVNDVTVTEGVGSGYAQFTVSLSNASTQATTVSLTTTDGTARDGVGESGAGIPDYSPTLAYSTNGGTTWVTGSTATIAAGATSILVRSAITDDAVNESTEAFTLTATRTAGVTTNASDVGTGTILDNDGAPSLSITGPGTVNEAIGVVVYTVTLTGSSATPVTVSYGTADGTALDGVGDPAGTVADYTPTSGMLTFNPGQTTQTITVPILNDTPRVYEGAETYTVNLSGPSGATIATPTATTTIMDDGTGTPPTSSTPDDDRPVLSVNDVTVTEGVGSGYAQFTVSLSNASTQATTVSLTTTDGTARDGVGESGAGIPDYSPTLAYSTNGGTTWVTGSTATIAAGATSILVRSAITDDAVNESTEAFTLTATRTAGVTTNASDVGTGTILDNDAAPTLAITGPATVNEAIGTVVYTVTLTGSSATPVTVSYGTADGTALDGVGDPAGTVADYTPTSGMLTFNPGQTTQTITVPILNDTPRVYEGAETYTVNLSGPSGATIATPTATTTIMDDGTGTPPTSSTPDDDRPVLSVNDVTVTEGVGSGYAQFTVSLSNASTQATTVSLTTTDGTARDGVGESGAGIPDYSPTLAYSTNGGTTWVTGSTATIAAGATSILVRSAITDDAVNESTEAFTLTATRTAGVTTNASDVGTGTILDNDGAPSLSITGPGTVNEAIGVVVYTVTLTGSSATPVTVSYGTADGTALDGVGDPAGTVADYTPTSGMLTFNPGQTTQTITVPILNDTPRVYEGAETYTVNLSGPSGATIATPTATTTIMDDGTGTPPTSSTPDDDRPVLSVNDVTVTEGVGSGYAQFTVSLSNASTQATTVSLTTTDGTARDGVGESGAGIPDYSPTLAYSTNGGTTWVTGSTATIAAGATSILVRSAITDDAVNESTEAFTLTATRTAGVTTNASDVGTGTILDNDAAPTLAITGPATVNEAIGTVVYTVTLAGSSATPVTVSYGTADGTALDGVGDPAGTVADYTPTSGMLTFNPGQTTQTITVPILNDTPRVYEGAETYTVNLSGPSGATIATPTATTTIMDDGTGTPPTSSTPDDDRPVLSVNDVTVTEGVGSGYAQFTVSLSNASTQATTVSLTTTDGTARDGVGESGAGIPDYSPTLAYSTNGGTTWVTGSTATIAAGATSILVRSAITNDNVAEPTEAFTLTATRTSGVTTNLSDVGTGTIIDNDINTVPTTQTTLEDTARAFSTANGNPITVSSPTGAAVTTVLTLTSGTLTLGSTAGLTSVSGNGTGTVTVTGTATAINAALENSVFRPVGDLHTSTPITMQVQSTSAGITDTDNVAINVTPVVDPATLYLHATRLGSGTLFSETFFDPSNWDNPAWTTTNFTATSFVPSGGDPTPGWDGQTSQAEWNDSWHSPSAPGGRAHYHTTASGTNDGTDDAYGFKSYWDGAIAGATQYVYSGNIQFGGPDAGGAGLVFGSSNNDADYYVVRLNKPTIAGNTGEDNSHPGTADRLELVRMTGGVPTVLGFVDGFTPGTNPWDLVIVVDAAGIRVSASGGGDSATINYTGGAGPALGQFGMYNYDNDNGVSFDNILVHNNRVSFTTVANLNDVDGSESLAGTVTLSNIPAGALLLDGSGNLVTVTGGTATVATNTSVTMLTAAALTDAQITAVTGSVVVTETAPGGTATTTVNALVDIVGTPTANTLTGTAAGEWITGLAGDDNINGGTGADVIIGGVGNDTLNGGTDAVVDTFRWNAGETGADTINGFGSAAGTDRLDLRDLLVGETHGNNDIGNLANYLSFSASGANTLVSITPSGSGAATQTILLNGVTLASLGTSNAEIIQNLINNNKLICD